jgi:hypothetical protein
MLVVTIATVAGTLRYGPALQKLGAAYGPAGHPPQMYLWGAIVVVCIAVWMAAYGLCAVIQRSVDVWQGFNLLPALLLTVIAANFAPQFANMLGFHWTEADPQAIQAAIDDNTAQIIMDDGACQADLENLGFPKFMRPFSLGAPNGLRQAREKLKKARAIEQACRERDEAHAARFRQAVEALGASPQTAQDASAGADADRSRLRQIETDQMAEYERMLDDLAASKAGWYAESYQMAFYNKRDLKLFKAHAAKAALMNAEHEAVSRRLWARNPSQSTAGNAGR